MVVTVSPSSFIIQSRHLESIYKGGEGRGLSWYVIQCVTYKSVFNLTLAIPALYRGTVPVLCIVGPRVSLQYMGLAMYKPVFEKLEGKFIPSHSSAGLAGVSE
jgi:hypothetical protein